MAYIDPVAVSPENYRVVMENDHVRVLSMGLKAGERDEVHSHPSGTVCFIKGGKAKISLPDRGSMEADLPDGHVMWHEGWTHQVENLGSSEIEAIVVESKQ